MWILRSNFYIILNYKPMWRNKFSIDFKWIFLYQIGKEIIFLAVKQHHVLKPLEWDFWNSTKV